MRYKGLVRLLRQWAGDRVPPYVFKETIYHSLWWIDHVAKCRWSLEVLDVGLLDFEEVTRQRILERDFGDRAMPGVREDVARTAQQRAQALVEGPGENEPVILMESPGGWELVEGWHRTMARLPRDGTSRVPLKAWVGRLPKDTQS